MEDTLKQLLDFLHPDSPPACSHNPYSRMFEKVFGRMGSNKLPLED